MTVANVFQRTMTCFGAAVLLCLLAPAALAQQSIVSTVHPVYVMPQHVQSRWTSPENPSGRKGEGAKANKGVKGAAYVNIPAHGKAVLLDVKGPGVVDRIKLSVTDRSPKALRSLRIAMYWDGAKKPAVRAPLGDFFGVAFGRTASFDNALFNDPEGRSFASTIPMPFKTGARIVIYNDTDEVVTHLYYNVNFQKWQHVPERMMYFHAWWHQNKAPVGKDFTLLPKLKGSGRFLGVTVGIRANPAYSLSKSGKAPLSDWFGEGEIKMWLDGDHPYPSLVGTGVEDYFGSAWGMGKFINPFDGCVIADTSDGIWSCYRYHMPDPIYFHSGIRVAIQQIGGGPLDQVRQIKKSGAPMKIISVDQPHRFRGLLSMQHPPKLMDPDFPKGWVNYLRSDLWSAVVYFYLDTPTDNLPAIAPLKERLKGIASDP